jgi:PHS family inorganic phosphate transporter-like MFS transporter
MATWDSVDDAMQQGPRTRMVLTAGLGFFTDAYDLFIIGTVTALLTPLWSLGTTQLMWLNSTSLLAAVAGSLVFGRLADRWGRRTMAIAESVILTAAALLSAFAPNFSALLVLRALMGLAIGGDYSTSSIIASEFSHRSRRGRLIATVFAMQGLGLVLGPLYATVLLASGVPHDLAWRLMLGFGALPALVVGYLRVTMSETPRFAIKQAVSNQADTVQHRLWDRKFLLRLMGTAGSWFLLDIAFYGNSVSSSLILKALTPHSALLDRVALAGLIFLVAALPGYWVAAATMDRLGRRLIQVLGFGVMAAAYGVLALVPGVTATPWLFLAIYGLSYFFIEFGPNSTTFVYPAELFPVEVRGTANGISAAAGKFGAFLGAFLFPLILVQLKLPGLMGILAVAAVLGAALTLLVLPEPRGLSLEQASGQIAPTAPGDAAAG